LLENFVHANRDQENEEHKFWRQLKGLTLEDNQSRQQLLPNE